MTLFAAALALGLPVALVIGLRRAEGNFRAIDPVFRGPHTPMNTKGIRFPD